MTIGSTVDTPDDMEPWRKRLAAAVRDSGKSMKEISLAAGLNQSFVRDALERGRKPKFDNLSALCKVLGTTASFILTGMNDAAPNDIQEAALKIYNITLVPVRGQAAAGRWMEFDETTTVYKDIPAVPTGYDGRQFAVQVVGTSMDKLRICDGDYVICVPFWTNVKAPDTGDIVVVERRRGPTFERTIKQAVVKADCIELWPRSTDPRFQTPIVIDPAGWLEGDGTEVELVGLVIAIHVPLMD